MRTTIAGSLGLLALLATAGCDRQPQTVARLRVEPGVVALAFPAVATVQLSWSVMVPFDDLGGQPTVFVHVLDDDGNLLRTFDHRVPEDRWRVGQSLVYDLKLFQSALAPRLPPGHYRLTMGIYDGQSQRWALKVDYPEVGRQEYSVAKVEVPEQGEPPLLRFSGAWKPLEAGEGRQVLTRRWLSGTGAITWADTTLPSRVHLVMAIPSEQTSSALKRVINEPGSELEVQIRSTCGGDEIRLSGSGFHSTELALSPDADDEECTVELRPNFFFVSTETLERISLSLETLAWVSD